MPKIKCKKCSIIVVLRAEKCIFANETSAKKCNITYGKVCISKTYRVER